MRKIIDDAREVNVAWWNVFNAAAASVFLTGNLTPRIQEEAYEILDCADKDFPTEFTVKYLIDLAETLTPQKAYEACFHSDLLELTAGIPYCDKHPETKPVYYEAVCWPYGDCGEFLTDLNLCTYFKDLIVADGSRLQKAWECETLDLRGSPEFLHQAFREAGLEVTGKTQEEVEAQNKQWEKENAEADARRKEAEATAKVEQAETEEDEVKTRETHFFEAIENCYTDEVFKNPGIFRDLIEDNIQELAELHNEDNPATLGDNPPAWLLELCSVNGGWIG